MIRLRNILFFAFAILAMQSFTSCKKDSDSAESKTGTVTDIEGNVYKTIKIGNQWWMAENLKVTKFRNGEVISNVTSNAEWGSISTPAFSCYNNDFDTYGSTYGLLYNWYAAADSRNIAPEGWHVPSDAEWQTLISFLGGESVAGEKMKEAGTSRWVSPNTGATNTSGFTALPAGSRYGTTGESKWLGFGNDYWSTTYENSANAWTRYLGNDMAGCLRLSHDKESGFSIRCVKD